MDVILAALFFFCFAAGFGLSWVLDARQIRHLQRELEGYRRENMRLQREVVKLEVGEAPLRVNYGEVQGGG